MTDKRSEQITQEGPPEVQRAVDFCNQTLSKMRHAITGPDGGQRALELYTQAVATLPRKGLEAWRRLAMEFFFLAADIFEAEDEAALTAFIRKSADLFMDDSYLVPLLGTMDARRVDGLLEDAASPPKHVEPPDAPRLNDPMTAKHSEQI